MDQCGLTFDADLRQKHSADGFWSFLSFRHDARPQPHHGIAANHGRQDKAGRDCAMGIIDKLIGKVRAIVAAEATDVVDDQVSKDVAKRDAHGRFVKGASKASVPSIKAKR